MVLYYNIKYIFKLIRKKYVPKFIGIQTWYYFKNMMYLIVVFIELDLLSIVHRVSFNIIPV